MRTRPLLVFSLALAVFASRPAAASFHLMQIEQVIGGINGHPAYQAIQLRTRTSFQNVVSNGRLNAFDATGSNPVLLKDVTTNVTNTGAGARILIATSDFATATGLTPDILLATPIPSSYLAAGSLTWEDDFGTVFWRLSWGGSGYTGTNGGVTFNDSNGDAGPPFAGPLPSTTTQALLFKNAFSALSTTNAADYALTAGSATFMNSSGQSVTLDPNTGVGLTPAQIGLALRLAGPNPVRAGLDYAIDLPRDAHVRVSVVDVGGRTVRALADETFAAGHHPLRWDPAAGGGAALANGLYFLELDALGTRRAQRFTLIQ